MSLYMSPRAYVWGCFSGRGFKQSCQEWNTHICSWLDIAKSLSRVLVPIYILNSSGWIPFSFCPCQFWVLSDCKKNLAINFVWNDTSLFNLMVSTYVYWPFMFSLPWIARLYTLLAFLLGFYFLTDFLIEIFIDIIVDLHAIIRNNTERPTEHFVQCPSMVTLCKIVT